MARAELLRPLDPEAQQDFIAIEHPSGFIDGAYARVAATLDQTEIYPAHMVQLAERIVSDGVQHEVRCITIKGALRPYEVMRAVISGPQEIGEGQGRGDRDRPSQRHRHGSEGSLHCRGK